jgi:hypothetical protein
MKYKVQNYTLDNLWGKNLAKINMRYSELGNFVVLGEIDYAEIEDFWLDAHPRSDRNINKYEIMVNEKLSESDWIVSFKFCRDFGFTLVSENDRTNIKSIFTSHKEEFDRSRPIEIEEESKN